LVYNVHYTLHTSAQICETLATLAISSEHLRDTCGHLFAGDCRWHADFCMPMVVDSPCLIAIVIDAFLSYRLMVALSVRG